MRQLSEIVAYVLAMSDLDLAVRCAEDLDCTAHDVLNGGWTTVGAIVERAIAKRVGSGGKVSGITEFDGPGFKSEGRYLTNEGYPLGTTCWYVRPTVCCVCPFLCADTPLRAAMLGHVFCDLMIADSTNARR